MRKYLLISHLLGLSFAIFLLFLSKGSTANAEGMSIDDLLIPEVPSMSNKTENNQQLDQRPKVEVDLDDLLGPKDIFPFLPDNHRDSGTGKFNSFW